MDRLFLVNAEKATELDHEADDSGNDKHLELVTTNVTFVTF